MTEVLSIFFAIVAVFVGVGYLTYPFITLQVAREERDKAFEEYKQAHQEFLKEYERYLSERYGSDD